MTHDEALRRAAGPMSTTLLQDDWASNVAASSARRQSRLFAMRPRGNPPINPGRRYDETTLESAGRLPAGSHDGLVSALG
jgi:hypothetical protein